MTEDSGRSDTEPSRPSLREQIKQQAREYGVDVDDLLIQSRRRDPQVVDSQTVSVWGQSSAQTTVGYETYPVRQTDRFPVWCLIDGPGRNDWDMTEVVVYPVG